MTQSESDTDSGWVDPVERVYVLHRLLADYPNAVVAAIDAHGNPVEAPDSIRLPAQNSLVTASPLEVVAPQSRGSLVTVLAHAKESGVAALPVVAVDGSAATCHIIDLRPTHGVLVGMIASHSPIDWSSALADRPQLIPRTGQIAKDAVAMILQADQRVCTMLGYDTADLVGMRSLDFIHPDDHQKAIDAWMEMLTSPGLTTRLRARHRRADGSWMWMELTNTNRLQHDEACVVCDMIDISDEMTAVEALRQRERLLTTLAEALPSGILHLDRHRSVVYSNTQLYRLTRVNPSATIKHYANAFVATDREAFNDAVERVFALGAAIELEVGIRSHQRTRQRRCAITMRPLISSEGDHSGAIICVDDITEAFMLRRNLELRATTDELTGCLNRSAVIDALEHTIARASSGTSGIAVVFIDLDGFKEVNDTFGHIVGDRLLAHAAQLLRRGTTPSDIVGRLGGDEFLIVLSNVADRGTARERVEHVIATLATPLEVVAGVPICIRASTGIVFSTQQHLSADNLIAAADRAMYRSKRAGDSQPVFVTA